MFGMGGFGAQGATNETQTELNGMMNQQFDMANGFFGGAFAAQEAMLNDPVATANMTPEEIAQAKKELAEAKAQTQQGMAMTQGATQGMSDAGFGAMNGMMGGF